MNKIIKEYCESCKKYIEGGLLLCVPNTLAEPMIFFRTKVKYLFPFAENLQVYIDTLLNCYQNSQVITENRNIIQFDVYGVCIELPITADRNKFYVKMYYPKDTELNTLMKCIKEVQKKAYIGKVHYYESYARTFLQDKGGFRRRKQLYCCDIENKVKANIKFLLSEISNRIYGRYYTYYIVKSEKIKDEIQHIEDMKKEYKDLIKYRNEVFDLAIQKMMNVFGENNVMFEIVKEYKKERTKNNEY